MTVQTNRFQEINAEASYDISKDVRVILFLLRNQEQLDSDVVDTTNSVGGSIDWLLPMRLPLQPT